MPVYLVRWYDLKASLIRARDERQLLQILDSQDDPSNCTWQIYRGSLWVDFRLPADFEVSRRRRALLSRSDVRVTLEPKPFSGELSLERGFGDYGVEMNEDVLATAFPCVCRVAARANIDDERPIGSRALRDAIAKDVLSHDRATQERGTTLVKRGGELDCAKTKLMFVQMKDEEFSRLDRVVFDRFCFGERSLPSRVGKIFIASLSIAYEGRTPLFATVTGAYAFTTYPNGMIVKPHQADAFGDDPHANIELPFKIRRNGAVRWVMSSAEKERLNKYLERTFRKPLKIETDSNS